MVGLFFVFSACSGPLHMESALNEGDFMSRTQTQTRDGISVTAAVPSAKESKARFGIDLYKRGIQSVWLEITNDTKRKVSFLPVGLDPVYYTPVEVANIDTDPNAGTLAKGQNLLGSGMDLQIHGGETRSGFVFSELDEGSKAFNVDIIAPELFESFTFFVPVPGLRVDHYNVDWEGMYPREAVSDLSADELIEWLEGQVCCTTDKKTKGSGDPVNLVIIGDLVDVYVAFIRAGWDETETVTTGTAWKTLKSFIRGGEYRYSPVSGLYVFGRPQDIAFQKTRGNIHERNHLRLWLAPVWFHGQLVWLGQISRDIGVRWTVKTITTHKIDPDVDETREYLLEDLAYAQALEKAAYVRGVGAVSMDQPAGNLTGDPWFSDGHRLVLWVTSQPVDLNDVTFEDWRSPPD
jgi:hypothetical protein